MKSKVWNKIFHKNKSSATPVTATPLSSSSNLTPSSPESPPDLSSLSSSSIRSINNHHSYDEHKYNNKKHSKDDSYECSNQPAATNAAAAAGTSATLSRLDYRQQQQQQQQPKQNINNNNNNNKSSSKISKMVNSFSLKRNTKKNKFITNSIGNGCNPDVAISIIRNNESTNLYNIQKSSNNKKYNNDDNLDNVVTSINDSRTISELNSDFDIPLNLDCGGGWQLDKTTPTISTNENCSNDNNIAELCLSAKSDYIKPLDNLNYQSEPIVMELKPCAICNRTFVPETLEKHIRICEKWATKKRKVFDSSRQRREGTEMAAYLPKDFSLSPPIRNGSIDATSMQSTQTTLEPRIEPNTHTALQNQRFEDKHHQLLLQQHSLNLSKPKLATTNNSVLACNQKKSLSPTSRMTTAQIAEIKARAEAKRHMAPVSEQCPECGRYFGIKAFDRHVEFCKEKSKIAQFKGCNTSQAKERLEARTKYRAPNLRLKRAAVRDKYSLNGDDENRIDDDFLSMSNSLSSSFMSDGKIDKEYDEHIRIMKQFETKNISSSSLSKSAAVVQLYPYNENELKIAERVENSANVVESTETIKNDENNYIKTLKKEKQKFIIGNCNHNEGFDNLNERQNRATDESICKVKDLKKLRKEQKQVISAKNLDQYIQNPNIELTKNEEILPICKIEFPLKCSTRDSKCEEPPLRNRVLEKESTQPKFDTMKRKCDVSLWVDLPHIKQNDNKNNNCKNISESNFKEIQVCRKITPQKGKTSFRNCFQKSVISEDHVKEINVPQKNNSNKMKNQYGENFWIDIGDFKNYKPSNIQKTNCVKERNEFVMKSGYSDKYDPFLSAKRQLEELCSPTSATKTKYGETVSPKSPLTSKHPLHFNNKKSSQQLLHSPISASMSTSYTGPSTTNSINPTKTLNAVKSNFRRTSSLRAPRKITPSRPIFVPPSRTRPSNIQRGISDEGPISTNFIKPEEYDEMPVKSACINNFATSINSPRLKRDPSPRPRLLSGSSRESSPKTFQRDPSPMVVRRNSNSNLNRRNLRLNLNIGDENLPSGVQKTDSLAVFLKYENELVRGLVDVPDNHEKNETQSPEIIQRPDPIPQIPPPSLVTEKDLKDKTNILSKQNSLKNSSSDLQVEKNFNYNFHNNEKDLKLSALKTNSNISDQHNINGRNLTSFGSRPRTAETYLTVNKILPIKLDPLPKSVVMKNSISNLATSFESSNSLSNGSHNHTPLLPSIKPLNKNSLLSHTVNNSNSNKVNLTSIFSSTNNNSNNNNSNNNSNSSKADSNYIDPKLINSCDNLKLTPSNSVDDIKSNWSQDSSDTTKVATNITNNNKDNFIPKDNDNENIDLESFSSQMKRPQQDQLSTSSRNTMMSEKNNKLFKRQIRLGKNQFLYDASPSDSESSPDLIEIDQNSDNDFGITYNRNANSYRLPTSSTSTSSSIKQSRTITTNLSPVNCEKEFDSLLSRSINPIFDNFNFDEFLATFDNNNDNDDSYPGLKDCKEFLMNRCLNMRSNINFNTNFHQFHHNNNNLCDSVIRSQKLEAEQNVENRKRSQNENEKHEIFISIETDQNENDESLDVNSCPSDPSIMKNPEVEEINGNDNKFTKIETYHLPVFEEDKDNTLGEFEIKSIPRSKLIKKLIREEDIIQNKNNVKENMNRDYENILDKTIESINSDLYPADSDDVSSVECYPVSRKSVKSKASSDSAYGSLSRNSPTSAERSSINRMSTKGHNNLPSTSNTISNDSKIKINRNRELNTSSSGSENSLLRINNNYIKQQQHTQQQEEQQPNSSITSSLKDSNNFLHENFNINSDRNVYNFRKDLSAKDDDSSNDSNSNCNKSMLSKFCYECGSKFLLSTAKFCMECGVKRLSIE